MDLLSDLRQEGRHEDYSHQEIALKARRRYAKAVLLGRVSTSLKKPLARAIYSVHMTFWQRIALSLATGYALFFYSERMFWSFLRQDDAIFFLVIAWILYSIFAYLFLYTIGYFKVRTLSALFLAGVAFGWIVEGIYAMTFFGIAGIPLPYSIIWTGVAWHALISVVIGWYFLYRSMVQRSYAHTIGLASLLGLFWGIWAVAWALETPPLFSTPTAFIVHAFLTTILFGGALWVTSRTGLASFTPGRWEAGVVLGVTALYFLLVTFPTVQFASLILIAAFGLVYALLYRNRKSETIQPQPSVLAVFDERAQSGKYLCLLAMPLVASVSYIGANALGIVLISNIITLFASSIVGTIVLIVSAYRIVRRKGQ